MFSSCVLGVWVRRSATSPGLTLPLCMRVIHANPAKVLAALIGFTLQRYLELAIYLQRLKLTMFPQYPNKGNPGLTG